MNKSQKIAFFTVITIVILMPLSLYAYCDPAFNFGFGPPTTGVILVTLIGFVVACSLYRSLWTGKCQVLKKNKIICLDERDMEIIEKAEYTGFSFSYTFFVFVSMIYWLMNKDEDISSGVLPIIVAGAYFSYEFARSIAVLYMYGRAGKEQCNE